MTDDHLPLALRRGRRASVAPPPSSHHDTDAHSSNSRRTRSSSSRAAKAPTALPATPSRGAKKRVRFSDPGAAVHDQDVLAASSASTGLTPSLRRTTLLLTPGSTSTSPSSSPSTKRRRRRLSSSDTTTTITDEVVQVTFLPLRQVIDGRVKRRIRRNGLSEEMNMLSAEKRRRAQQTKEAMEALRAEVAAKDAQIRRLSGATVVEREGSDGDSDAETEIEGGRRDRGGHHQQQQGESIDDLKRQVEELRHALKSPAPSSRASSRGDAHIVGWNDGEGGGGGGGDYYHSDMELDFDESDDDNDEYGFGESTIADLVCSTPSRRPSRTTPHSSFPTPPSSGSPPPRRQQQQQRQRQRLGTPCSEEQQQQQYGSPVMEDAGVQVQLNSERDDDDDDDDEEEKREMEQELASLHLEVAKLTSTLESYEAVTSRLSDKLSPFQNELDHGASSNNNNSSSSSSSSSSSAAAAILASRPPTVRIEAQLNTLLETLTTRSAALAHMTTSLHKLGFPGSSPSESLTALATTLRTVRLELEYLDPGEIPLPLTTTSGAVVLDLLLDRLRALARHRAEDASVLAEYEDLAHRLRAQLATRVEAMAEMRAEAGTLEKKVQLRNLRIRELESALERLRASVSTYTRDIGELEALAQRLEADLDGARKEGAAAVREAAETEAVLEERLGEAQEQIVALGAELALLRREEEEVDKEEEQDHACATCEGLSREVSEVTAALWAAQTTIGSLQRETGLLSARVGQEKGRARAAVEAIKVELERAVRMGEDLLLASPKSPDRD